MSAYLVDENHINYLVNAARDLRVYSTWHKKCTYELNEAELTEIGQHLWDENIASVRGRYPDSKDDLPGPIFDGPVEEFTIYTYKSAVYQAHAAYYARMLQIIKSCHCYAYQACEHDGWESSKAKHFVDSLEGAAIRKLPDFDKTDWGAPKPDKGIVRLIG